MKDFLRKLFVMDGDRTPQPKASSAGDYGFVNANYGWTDSSPYGNAALIDPKSSLAISTNFNCQNGISADVAMLPFKVQRNGVNSAGLETRTPVSNDPIAKIFQTQFNPRMCAYTGISMMERWRLGIGNAYAEIVRDGSDVPIELHPIHPARVPPNGAKEKRKSSDKVIADAKAYDADPYSLIFEVYNGDGTKSFISERDLLWLRGPSEDGYFGMASVAIMQNSLGLDSAVQRFLKNFYQNSARPGLIITSAHVIRKEQREELKRQFAEATEGPHNAGRTLVLDNELDVKSFQQSFEAMELSDLRSMSREDIAAFYRYPLAKLQVNGTAQGWDTMHANEKAYVNDCLKKSTTPLLQEIHRQLMCEYDSFAGYDDDIQCHLEFKGRLEGDEKSRAAYLQFRFNTASITPNEIRELEDENPNDDPSANKLYVQGAMVPLDMCGQQIKAAMQAASEPDSDESKPKNRIGVVLNGTH